MDRLIEYANTYKELHRKLNDIKYKGDINAEYKALWGQVADLTAFTKSHLDHDGYVLSLHDAYVENFSQRKAGNDYRITFAVDTLVYAVDLNLEIGRQRVEFEFMALWKLREIANREVSDFLIDPATKSVLFIYWGINHKLKYVIVHYETFAILPVGEVVKYA
jgi:hypothetical protein